MKMGRLGTAKRVFKELAQERSYGYYSIASRSRLALLGDVDDSDPRNKKTSIMTTDLSIIPKLRQPATFEMIAGAPEVTVVEAEPEEPEETKQLEEQEKEISAADEDVSEDKGLDVASEEEDDDIDEDEEGKASTAQLDDEVEAPAIIEAPSVTSFRDPRLARRFQRANDLRMMGFDDWARWELYGIERRTANRTYLKMLMSEYEAIDAFRRSSYIGQIFFRRPRMQSGMEGVRYLWEFTYPRAYKKSVRLYSDRYGIAPEFAWAIMRAESHYNKEATSSVGALGLMQIMPNTGIQVAKLLEREGFEVKDLFEPKTNIELGIRYLNRLSKKFKNRVPLIASAYNAGPHRMEAWLKNFGNLDMDEFIEHIPFSQTRNYAKKVVRNYYVYQRLYFEKDIVSSPITWLSQPVGVTIKGPVATRETWEVIE